jgi:2-dehydro-3-deoxyphosphogalactonate aldolase
MRSISLDEALAEMPLIAILRGITASEALAVGQALADCGIRAIEVPLNSPEPIESIRLLTRELGRDCCIGAGTVTSAQQVTAVAGTGARLIVSPILNPDVVTQSLTLGLDVAPGVFSPTEVFLAYELGVRFAKLFPAEVYGPSGLSALSTVSPRDLRWIPVGGVNPGNASVWMSAGACGLGIGSALYRPGQEAGAVGLSAKAFIEAVKSGRTSPPQ